MPLHHSILHAELNQTNLNEYMLGEYSYTYSIIDLQDVFLDMAM